MRWIFFSLVVMNLAVLAWALVAGSSEKPVQNVVPLQNPYADVPQLIFLQEASASDLASVKLGGGGRNATNVVENQPAPRDLCDLVGPFESQGVANDFVSRLKAIEVIATIKDIDFSAGPGFWVYLKPQPSKREALRLLGELQAKKIDSYVIPKGELENGISLGMFSKKELAVARQHSMEKAGLEPQLEEIERSYRETWVMVSKDEGAKMSDLSWERAMEGINLLERRQNYCLDVASQENFQ